METQTINRVQSDWAKVAPIAATAAELFYGRLFELDPGLRPMFPEDMAGQKRKLMQVLGAVIGALRDLEDAIPTIQALGVRHVDYGVTPDQYDTVGAALLWTLETGLGDAWSADSENAWSEVYSALASIMIDAAAASTAAPAATAG